MSSLRLVVPRFGTNLFKNRSIGSANLLARRAYHYADTGGNYRLVIPPVPETNIRWKCITVMQTTIWTWIFYNIWYDPNLLLGHLQFQPPDESSFTDEELGLPPEGEDDELFQ